MTDRRIPRRGRRGLSVIGGIIFMTLFTVSTVLVTDVVGDLLHDLAVQSEARSLSHLADAARNHAARNPTDLMDTIRTSGGRVVLSAADLRSTGWLPARGDLLTSRRREVGLAAVAASSATTERRIVIMAWTGSVNPGRPALARPGPGISHVGRVGRGLTVDACDTGHICGAGLDWDAASVLSSLPSAPPAGAMVAVRLVHFAADRDPYLHRLDVGEALVNQVEGDFNMNEHVMLGTASPGTWTITETQVDGNATTVAATEFGPVTVLGRTAVLNDTTTTDMEAARVTTAGEESRSSLIVDGLVTAGAMSVADRMGAASWAGAGASAFRAEGLAVDGRMQLASRLTVEDSWPPGGTPPAGAIAPRLTAGNVEIAGDLEVTTAGHWGTGEMAYEITDVNVEARLGSRLSLDSGGRGLIEFLDLPGCTGCDRTTIGPTGPVTTP